MRYGKQKGEKISGGRANRNCDHEKEEKISELRYGKQNVKKISELRYGKQKGKTTSELRYGK